MQCQPLQDALQASANTQGIARLTPSMDALMQLLGGPTQGDWAQRTASMSDMLHGTGNCRCGCAVNTRRCTGNAWERAGHGHGNAAPLDDGMLPLLHRLCEQSIYRLGQLFIHNDVLHTMRGGRMTHILIPM